jgi:hypothetical protein
MQLISTGAVLNKTAGQLGIAKERTNKRVPACFNFSFPEGQLAKKRVSMPLNRNLFLLGGSFSSFPNMFGQVVQHSTYRTQVRVQQYGTRGDRL